jgi:circadian clock protein KaiC
MLAPNPSGVAGLDAALRGGYPRNRTTVVAGGPGSGKTVLALQFLYAGATAHGEPGLFVAFEESPEALRQNGVALFSELDACIGHSVHILDGRIPEDAVETGAFDLGGLIAVVTALVKQHGIKRLAIDGIDALFALGAQDPNRRRELLRVLRWLSEVGVTTLITVKSDGATEGIPARFSFTDFAADGVLHLRSSAAHDHVRRTLRIIKVRGAGFFAGDHPYTVSASGFRVLASPRQTEIATPLMLGTRLSSGIERLDRMLSGGYRAGTVTLVSGLPGTSKTTLGAEFLWAGCRAGERVAFVGFDEPAEQMIYDAQSLGIELEPYAASGQLRAESYVAGTAIGDEHYLAVEVLLESNRPTRLVIDPVTALAKSGGLEIADVISERIAVFCKSRGITALFTAVSDARGGELESTLSRVSTIADTWIHLSFAAQNGERNRTLTIVKARGTAHSNQLREIVLSNDGVTLADVYTVDGDVLLGTARLRREQEAVLEAAAAEQKAQLELRQLDEEHANLSGELQDMRRRLDQIDAHREEIVSRENARATILKSDAALLREARFGDPEPEDRVGTESA